MNTTIIEPILDPKNERTSLLPIIYQDIWECRQKQKAVFWTNEELQLSQDMNDWNNKLNKDEKFFLCRVLAFFARSDMIVNDNLCQDFINKIKIPEFQMYYITQMFIETEHSLVYASLIDTYIRDTKEKEYLFNATENIPIIKKKSDWAYKWITSGTFVERLVAFAIMEGIFFSGSFCAIFFFKKRGLMHNLTISNEFISRDEGIHRDTACLIYRKYIKNKLSEELLIQMVREAVNLEHEFVTDALPVSLIGMNCDLMCRYIEYVADHLLVELIGKKIFNVENPFSWMILQSLNNKSNFFEVTVTSYSKNITTEGNEIKFDENF
jgi:ribonucleoside-diphosphate reductase beta chain